MKKYIILWDNNYWISFGDWLAEPRYSAQYDAPSKIIIRQTGDSLIATLDTNQFIARDNLYTIVPRYKAFDLRYILGLINSLLMNWFYQNIINPEAGEALAQVKRGHLALLPISLSVEGEIINRKRHDRMVQLVQRMLDLHQALAAAQTPNEKTALQRQIKTTDQQIDKLVYELYDLTKEEIEIVIESNK